MKFEEGQEYTIKFGSKTTKATVLKVGSTAIKVEVDTGGRQLSRISYSPRALWQKVQESEEAAYWDSLDQNGSLKDASSQEG